MPREIKLFGLSLDKAGKRKKKIVDIPYDRGIAFFTIKNNKLLLLDVRRPFITERAIVYDLKKDVIETDYSFNNEIVIYYAYTTSSFTNLSFVSWNGIFCKYDFTNKTYNEISLGVGEVRYFKILSDRLIVVTFGNIFEFDLEGNLIKSEDLPILAYCVLEVDNKIYVYYNWSNVVCEYDISTSTLRTIELPIGPSGCLTKVKGANCLHIFEVGERKIYRYDLDTEELTLLKDLNEFDIGSIAEYYNWFSKDGKILFATRDEPAYGRAKDMFIYNLQTNELRRYSIFEGVENITEVENTRIFVILDSAFTNRLFVYDYDKDEFISVMNPNSSFCFFCDESIIYTV